MTESLTCWEAARLLKVKPNWVHRLIDRGILKMNDEGIAAESVTRLIRRRRDARERPEGYLSVQRAAEFLGISRQRVQQLCRSGTLRSRSVEGRVWVDGESVFKRAESRSQP